MKIYVVLYYGFDFGLYYSGAMNCNAVGMKFFSTEERAKNFVNSELREKDQFGVEHIIKRAGDGDISVATIDEV